MYVNDDGPFGCLWDGNQDQAGQSLADTYFDGFTPTPTASSWYQEQLTLQQLLHGADPKQLAAVIDRMYPPAAASQSWSQAQQDQAEQAANTPYWGDRLPALFGAQGNNPVPVQPPTCTRKTFAYSYPQCITEQVINVETATGEPEKPQVIAVEKPTNAWLIAAGIMAGAALLG